MKPSHLFGTLISNTNNVRKRNYGFKVMLGQSINKVLAEHQEENSLVPGKRGLGFRKKKSQINVSRQHNNEIPSPRQ